MSTITVSQFPKIKKQPLHSIPIRPCNSTVLRKINNRAEQIVAAKRKNPAADTSVLEREIDEAVYALYGLTPKEITIVEEATT